MRFFCAFFTDLTGCAQEKPGTTRNKAIMIVLCIIVAFVVHIVLRF
jgi:hypothetical protein